MLCIILRLILSLGLSIILSLGQSIILSLGLSRILLMSNPLSDPTSNLKFRPKPNPIDVFNLKLRPKHNLKSSPKSNLISRPEHNLKSRPNSNHKLNSQNIFVVGLSSKVKQKNASNKAFNLVFQLRILLSCPLITFNIQCINSFITKI